MHTERWEAESNESIEQKLYFGMKMDFLKSNEEQQH